MDRQALLRFRLLQPLRTFLQSGPLLCRQRVSLLLDLLLQHSFLLPT